MPIKKAEGDLSLILDSTRPLRIDALEILLNYKNYDMVIIKEESLGDGFWVNQAKLLKEISERQYDRIR